jgi:hypothetical protein
MLIRTGFGGQLSGSVGGVVAAHNKGGQYLRNRSIPTNPRTDRQQSVRAAFSAAAESWSGLTVAQREAWEGYAVGTPVVNRLGESITLSGFNMYVRAYAFLAGIAANLDGVGTAPVTPGIITLVDPVATLSVSVSAANGVTLTGLNGSLVGLLVSISPSLGAGVSSFGGPFTSFLTNLDPSAIDGVATQGNQAVNRYGEPIVGQRRAIRIAGVDGDNRLSDVQTRIVTVAA